MLGRAFCKSLSASSTTAFNSLIWRTVKSSFIASINNSTANDSSWLCDWLLELFIVVITFIASLFLPFFSVTCVVILSGITVGNTAKASKIASNFFCCSGPNSNLLIVSNSFTSLSFGYFIPINRFAVANHFWYDSESS